MEDGRTHPSPPSFPPQPASPVPHPSSAAHPTRIQRASRRMATALAVGDAVLERGRLRSDRIATCMRSAPEHMLIRPSGLFVARACVCAGERTKDPQDLLCEQKVPKAHAPQGDAVQDRQGLAVRAGQAALRREAEGLWWPDQARLPEEGQDDQEGRAPPRVQRVQVQDAARHQALQAL